MKKALLVGINNYPGTGSDLSGCLNDVADAFTTLKTAGFSCTTYKDTTAKRSAIISAFKSLVLGSKSGDSLVFYYSGHGSRVRDASGDESDGYDEVLCPADWPQYVSDDSMRAILATVPKGVTVDVILDCCHSGTGTREIDQGYKIRALPPIVDKRCKPRAAVVVSLNHCLWAGCAANQVSAELNIGGKVRGAFSYYLWKEIRAGGTRSAIMARVCKQVAALGLKQTPQLEALKAEMAQLPFS